jgi:four helix bundle protein
MAKIERFEDLETWKKARELAKKIHTISSKGFFRLDADLRSQIRRAVISIGSNIAEGFERDGNKEFLQYLSQAKGSAGEVRSQVYSALDFGHLTNAEFESLIQECLGVSRLIGGFQLYLRKSEKRGLKFRSTQPGT